MTEREKMINGLPYDAFDNKLVEDRLKAKTLCVKYNQLMPNDTQKQQEILKSLFNTIGDNCVIQPNFFCDYGYNLYFGNNVYINHNSVFLDCAKIQIGNNVFIGPNCGFYTAIHPFDKDERNAGIETAKHIIIGNNVWIGGSVTILPNVTIGDNTVIGAGSVVTRDIESNVVAFGNPCKKIREIK